MQVIVAADTNWGIGLNGSLLTRIPADMKRFRELTLGGVVVLGRKTLQTFPQGLPLDGRQNIIFSKNPSFTVKGADVVHDITELKKRLQGTEKDRVFCIGGEQIYRLLLPLCDRCLVTRIERAYDADAFFPDLDADPAWEKTEESDEQTYFDTVYTFCTYERIG